MNFLGILKWFCIKCNVAVGFLVNEKQAYASLVPIYTVKAVFIRSFYVGFQNRTHRKERKE